MRKTERKIPKLKKTPCCRRPKQVLEVVLHIPRWLLPLFANRQDFLQIIKLISGADRSGRHMRCCYIKSSLSDSRGERFSTLSCELGSHASTSLAIALLCANLPEIENLTH